MLLGLYDKNKRHVSRWFQIAVFFRTYSNQTRERDGSFVCDSDNET